MWRKGDPFALLVEMHTAAATVESSKEIPQKIKNGTALWLRDSTSGNLSEETQNTNLKEHKHPYAHCSITYNCQNMEAAQVSISKWMGKTTMGHLHSGKLLGCKKKESFTFATAWIDLENIMLSEISQSDKNVYHMISLICGI